MSALPIARILTRCASRFRQGKRRTVSAKRGLLTAMGHHQPRGGLAALLRRVAIQALRPAAILLVMALGLAPASADVLPAAIYGAEAGGAVVSSTPGTITASLSAPPDAGTYTATATISNGVSVSVFGSTATGCCLGGPVTA